MREESCDIAGSEPRTRLSTEQPEHSVRLSPPWFSVRRKLGQRDTESDLG